MFVRKNTPGKRRKTPEKQNKNLFKNI